MLDHRGSLDTGSLLRTVLALLIVMFVLQIAKTLFNWVLFGLHLLRPVIVLGIAVLVALWLLDRL